MCHLFSDGSNLDIRDFGWRAVGPVTGSMSGSSTTLTLNSPADFRVGDQVIVEIGGEAGVGARNTIGVGGVTPVLNYANKTAMKADASQPNPTYAYLGTDGSVWKWNGSSWSAAQLGGSYYIGTKNPLSLVARVTAVNASPATQLTLSVASSVATTNANVYLDALSAFYPYTTHPAQVFNPVREDGLDSYNNMSITLTAGTFYFSNGMVAYNAGSGGNRTGFTLAGAGIGATTLQNPKGVPSQLLNVGTGNSNIDVSGFTYVGNLADNGYGLALTGTNKQFAGDYPTAMQGGTSGSNLKFHDLACINDMRGCVSIQGTNPQILNATATINVGQRAYLQWQFQLVDCTRGQIANSTATGTYLLKSFEIFACNGASINNSGGRNALYSSNSSSNWKIDFQSASDTITRGAFFNTNSGAIDEAIINVNDNAFKAGNTGAINNPRIIQQGYVDTSNNSLKFIQIDSHQMNVTVQGQFPGASGCSKSLGGFMQAPDYNPGSAEYGAMAVYSDAPNTTISGIRIKGAAIGSPGHSGHWGNISLAGSGSAATSNVAEVIQPGPSISGNQTNVAYGAC